MRHGKKFNHLGRTAPHRRAMLSNMATSLILHKRINTTVAKAKALRKYVEPLLTKAKDDTTHSRRVVFSYLQDKESVKALFGEVAEKIAGRPGGYTRILKTGNRLGDNAEMCMIELVDYNEALLKDAKPAKAKTRRSRRGGKSGEETAAVSETKTAVAAEVAETPPVAEEVAEVVEETTTEEVVAEEVKAETVEEVEAVAEEVEAVAEEPVAEAEVVVEEATEETKTEEVKDEAESSENEDSDSEEDDSKKDEEKS